jgi:glutaredoxin-related protein
MRTVVLSDAQIKEALEVEHADWDEIDSAFRELLKLRAAQSEKCGMCSELVDALEDCHDFLIHNVFTHHDREIYTKTINKANSTLNTYRASLQQRISSVTKGTEPDTGKERGI